MDKKYITKNYKQTQKLGEDLAKKILKLPLQKRAIILGLRGNLGGGKTTFLQGFAKGLKVKEKILSPTFVILKHFKIINSKFTDFYHVDCYRINNVEEIMELGFKEIISNSKNIVAVEWSERIRKILPKSAIEIDFKFIGVETREIGFEM